jgi:hypothetical protein
LWALLNVMGGAMMFGPVVSLVCLAGMPEETELFLGFTPSEPVKSHVHCFHSLRLDVAVDDSKRGAVVSLYQSW